MGQFVFKLPDVGEGTAEAEIVAWHVRVGDVIKEDAPLLHGITHTPRFVIFGGGMPIMDGENLIGAVGVSGGHYTQDMEVAKAGIAAIS